MVFGAFNTDKFYEAAQIYAEEGVVSPIPELLSSDATIAEKTGNSHPIISEHTNVLDV